ncbi:MAG: hypothetical protein H7Y04_00595 [Verrucomicrobia bacterium]|nr:hypothetical protein [Cytophagales bacterium]
MKFGFFTTLGSVGALSYLRIEVALGHKPKRGEEEHHARREEIKNAVVEGSVYLDFANEFLCHFG